MKTNVATARFDLPRFTAYFALALRGRFWEFFAPMTRCGDVVRQSEALNIGGGDSLSPRRWPSAKSILRGRAVPSPAPLAVIMGVGTACPHRGEAVDVLPPKEDWSASLVNRILRGRAVPSPVQRWFRLGLGLALMVATLLALRTASAQSNFFTFSVTQGSVQIALQTNAYTYYVVRSSPDLQTFTPVEIALGQNGPVYQTPATNLASFFQMTSISIFSPEDTLGDGIDDVFKLNLGLNPLDPTLANSFSGHYSTDGQQLTWLQYYNVYYGRATNDGEVYGRENSVFNAGAPFGSADSISREVSVFNFGQAFGSADAISREISVYNGQSPPTDVVPQEAYSREVSVFNYGQPFGSADTISREVSVFNGQSPPTVVVPQEAYSREVSVFNYGQPFGSADAISREVSVFNNIQ